VIGLATCRDLPELTGGEQLHFQELSKRTECSIVVWNDPQESWRKCSQIIVRCTWDYSSNVLEFLKWIDRVEAAGIRLHNPPNILRWNSDKLYLRDLVARGVLIPETVWIPRGKLTEELLAESVHGPSVLKPTVSAGAYDTHRVSPENVGNVFELLREVNLHKGLMLQPFIEEVVSPGEYSLMYFANEYSHAVLKTPRPGDFRVQPRYGGEQVTATVAPEIVTQARGVLEKIPFAEKPLYARVDGVIREGQFVLMELELIEPYLFLEFGDGADSALAKLVYPS